MNKKLLLSMILLPATCALPAVNAYALDPNHFPEESVLASGKWARVKASGAGMNLITDAQLRNLGFTNPENVRVYGLGGHELSFGLDLDTPGDMPLLPSVRTSKGLVFFATDHVTWSVNNTLIDTPYSHYVNQYTEDSYYYISDRAADEFDFSDAQTSAVTVAQPVTTFVERSLHEKDLYPIGNSGSDIWGEDFRSNKSQTFTLALPGNADGLATVNVAFGAKQIGGTKPSIIVSADGKALPSTSSDQINLTSKTDVFGQYTNSVKYLEDVGDKVDIGIDFSYSGVLYVARLDFIEAFYNRRLKLDNGELHFYLSLHPGEGVSIAGCSESTVIWDVTDPVMPKLVSYKLDGDRASFMITASGYREFVAFNPESVTRTAASAGSVTNQNLHGLESPDMVIFTYPEYAEGARLLADLHREQDGMVVHVVDADQAFLEFGGGNPDPGAFRRLMKMWYDRSQAGNGRPIRYCLLMGKAISDNKQISAEAKALSFRPMPLWQNFGYTEEGQSYSCESWLGGLNDVSNARFDRRAEIQVAVGRIPCTSSSEAVSVANKIRNYSLNPNYGPWRNKVMIIADDADHNSHIIQGELMYKQLRMGGYGEHYNYDRLYLDKFELAVTGIGNTYPQATEQMLNNYNDGVMFTNYIGHGNPTSWGHEHLWDWQSIISMKNKNLTFIYGATCRFVHWDDLSTSAGEHLMLNPDGGVVGMIAASRSVYVAENGRLNSATMRQLFEPKANGSLKRWGDVFMDGFNCTKDPQDGKSMLNDNNKLRYVIVGDPALRVIGSSRQITFNTFNGEPVNYDEPVYSNDPEVETVYPVLPEFPAMSTVTVEGDILTPEGTVDTGFNGTLNLQLFDAERAITTHGNGSNGDIYNYNDRDKRLTTINTSVVGGHWKATFRIPPEIQGNYNTALFVAYAWSTDGAEANGSCDRFYVYGVEENVDDTTGPIIETFYVNSPNLGPEDPVCPNMTVFARLRDESGINLSQSGIGHAMTLNIDGKTYLDGLDSHFTSDSNDPDLGYLSYPLTDIEPGKHTLTLTAWDNANNVSKKSIDIVVGAAVDPVIFDITANNNTTSVDFRIAIDRPNTSMVCNIGIFDLMGRRIWGVEDSLDSDESSVINTTWNLCDKGGRRVPRGIYIYRATVETPEGLYSSKSKKIAIAAEE